MGWFVYVTGFAIFVELFSDSLILFLIFVKENESAVNHCVLTLDKTKQKTGHLLRRDQRSGEGKFTSSVMAFISQLIGFCPRLIAVGNTLLRNLPSVIRNNQILSATNKNI